MRISILLILLISATPAFADYYIVNQENQVVSRVGYEPSAEELQQNGLVAIEASENIPLQKAEYRGNKIVERVKTSKEKAQEKALKEKQQERALIEDRLIQMGADQLRSEGVDLKYH